MKRLPNIINFFVFHHYKNQNTYGNTDNTGEKSLEKNTGKRVNVEHFVKNIEEKIRDVSNYYGGRKAREKSFENRSVKSLKLALKSNPMNEGIEKSTDGI